MAEVLSPASAKFMDACKGGHLTRLVALLRGTDDDRVDVRCCSDFAFRAACVNGHLEVVKALLALGGARRVDVHAKRDFAFRWACSAGRLDVVTLLLGLRGDRGISLGAPVHNAFVWSCRMGQVGVVKALMAHTLAPPTRDMGLLWASAAGETDVVKELLGAPDKRAIGQRAAGYRAAYRAARAGGFHAVLLEFKAVMQ
jgi:ankyrin repeat protein